MKRLILFMSAAFLLVPGAFAQDITDHVNVGVFGNYVRLNNQDLNLAGIGARLSFNVLPVVQFEAESTYNFDQAFTPGFTEFDQRERINWTHRCPASRRVVWAEADDQQRAGSSLRDRERRLHEFQYQQCSRHFWNCWQCLLKSSGKQCLRHFLSRRGSRSFLGANWSAGGHWRRNLFQQWRATTTCGLRLDPRYGSKTGHLDGSRGLAAVWFNSRRLPSGKSTTNFRRMLASVPILSCQYN